MLIIKANRSDDRPSRNVNNNRSPLYFLYTNSPVHMNCQHNRTSADVLHDCVVVSVKSGQVLLIAKQYVGFEAVFIIGINTSADSSVLAHPVARMDVYNSAHKIRRPKEPENIMKQLPDATNF